MKTKNLLLKVLFVFSPSVLGNNLQPSVMIVENARDSFSHSTVITSAPKDLQLQRSYHSIRLHKGLLGYGWCLDFDKMLKITAPNQLTLHTCNTDHAIRYELNHSSEKGMVFKSKTVVAPPIIKIHSQYQIHWNIDESWTFNTKGQLVAFSKLRQRYNLEYDENDQLSKILFRNGSSIAVQLNRLTGTIENLKSGDAEIRFQYNQQLLTHVTTPTHKWRYTYDASRNLSHIYMNKKLLKKIIYDMGRDSVESLISSSYITKLNNAGQIASIRHPQKGTFFFHYSKNGQLQSLELQSAQKVILASIHEASNSSEKIQLEPFLRQAAQVYRNLKQL